MGFAFSHGDAEIDQNRAAGGNHDVGGLDVPVDDPSRMDGVHGVDQLFSQTGQILTYIRAVLFDIVAQVEAIDQLGDQES